MAQSRMRNKLDTVSKGTGYHSSGIAWSGNNGLINIGYREVNDVVRTKHEDDCQPFHVFDYHITGGRLNKTGLAGNGSHCENWYPTVYDTWNNFPHHGVLYGSPDDYQVAANAAARSSPSKPYVDVPVALLELRELTDILRGAGQSLIRKAAGANLAWNFGLAPMVDDVGKLLKFQHQLDRRMKVLKKLQEDKSYRKTTKHGGYTESGYYTKTLQSQGVFISRAYACHTYQTVKAHCRWKPIGSFNSFGDAYMRALANKALMGYTADPATMWELLPWSWLMDWAGSVGDFFKANRNIVPASLQSCSVIRHTKTVYELPAISQSDWSLEATRVVREDKNRRRVSVVPSAHFPVLDGSQMGILASLSILRSPRWLIR